MVVDILHPERLRVAAVVSFYMASALVVSIYLICTVSHYLTLLADGLCVRPEESPFLIKKKLKIFFFPIATRLS
jgi:hypothetical protein